jgi:HSP20 family molecular chaperone IbpA
MTTLTTPSKNTATSPLIKPRADLYASEQGWQLIVALMGADRDQVELHTEGRQLSISAPLASGEGRYFRELSFPLDTRWGDLNAHWEGELLYVDLQREQPLKRRVHVEGSLRD